MKNLLFILSLLFVSSFTFADHEEEGEKKKKSEKYDHMNTAPKIKTAPFIQGLANETTLELFKEGRKHMMIIDTEKEHILFDGLKEETDFVRIYTDETDGRDCLIIWRKIDTDEKTGEISWKKFTYKEFEDIGWRPVDNSTTQVKSYK
ncbi:hypothetical protein MY04_0281 [Flammeovirga sp. MY04]|uniref:hypothetical protein n=1 Tax=Flammeovirga sp. MY04 TaxID=1191459 RepID=UPI0008062E15|nr:hypothetical protein [Flammeovirga sp. MY04]ANQ47663.1 hypothetical protein MY04_0281 [Flammeovirga sp. MY04]